MVNKKGESVWIYIPGSIRNDPTRLESRLRYKAKQRGLNFDSDYKNLLSHWKELADHI
ncbi:MAG: hypothetical protein ACTSR8_10695 [Promethearchaeota archaeon]